MGYARRTLLNVCCESCLFDIWISRAMRTLVRNSRKPKMRVDLANTLPASTVLGEPAEFIPNLHSQLQFFFHGSSPGACGPSLLPFATGVNFKAARGRLFLFTRRTWPSHHHLLCFTSSTCCWCVRRFNYFPQCMH